MYCVNLGIILLFTSALKSMLSVSASPKRTNAPPIVGFDTSKSAIVTFSMNVWDLIEPE